MLLPDQTPRLPKWPFLLGDAGLLLTALFIGSQASSHMTSSEILTIAGCVACAAIIGAIPFISDYARKQDEALDERQRSLESLSRTITTSADQISIAADGFNKISELAQNNLKQAEQLPHKLQEKIAEFQARSALAADLGKKELERLEANAEKITKAASVCLKAEAAVQKQITSAMALVEQLEDKITQLNDRIAKLNTSGSKSKPAVTAKDPEIETPKAEELVVVEKEIIPEAPAVVEPAEVVPVLIEEKNLEVPTEVTPTETADLLSGATPETTEPAPVEVKPERKRSAKKQAEPKVDTSVEIDVQDEVPAKEEAPALSLEFSDVSADEAGPTTAVSADGATRITATAYIGIGNRLFIRGDGPGLSWDKGIPLQFVSIGKWRWETMDADKAISFKLYKNDEVESTNRNHAPLEPGSQVELNATF